MIGRTLLFNGKKIIGLIIARGGSKGLPGKNLLPLGGQPLISWSVAAGKKSKYLDRLVLSSDDDQIIATANNCGCEVPFVRPTELATDDTSASAVVLHALGALKEQYDYLVLLQATSPFRTAKDIDTCIENCILRNAATLVTVCAVSKSPYWMYHVDQETHRISHFTEPLSDDGRRQNLPKVFGLNGAVYVVQVDQFKKSGTFREPRTIAYEMPAERSVDIDRDIDYLLAEAIVKSSDITPIGVLTEIGPDKVSAI